MNYELRIMNYDNNIKNAERGRDFVFFVLLNLENKKYSCGARHFLNFVF